MNYKNLLISIHIYGHHKIEFIYNEMNKIKIIKYFVLFNIISIIIIFKLLFNNLILIYFLIYNI